MSDNCFHIHIQCDESGGHKCMECGRELTIIYADEMAGIEAGLADFAAGRTKPLSEIKAELSQPQSPTPEIQHDDAYLQAAAEAMRKVASFDLAPTPEAQPAKDNYMRHAGPWKCILCPHEVPYDEDWNVMARALQEHQATAHPYIQSTPPGQRACPGCGGTGVQGSGIGGFTCPTCDGHGARPEAVTLPPLERAQAVIAVYDSLPNVDFRRVAKSLAEQMFTERDAERAAHERTRRELEEKLEHVSARLSKHSGSAWVDDLLEEIG